MIASLTIIRKRTSCATVRVLCGLCAVLIAGCAPAGQEAARPAASTREAPTFVSLNPCLDAILVEVATRDQVLALSHYSRDPAGSSINLELARSLGVTGGTAEEVIALAPDIVLASTFMPAATRSALERSGLQVETFGSPSTVAQSLEQIDRIAQLAQRPMRGHGLRRSIALQQKPDFEEPVSALLWQPGQIVPGEATLVSEHLEWAGFSSHAAARGMAQADHVSLEAVLADPPDLLLVAGDAAGQRHPLLATLDNTRVESFEPGLLYCGGPVIVRARARLAQLRRAMAQDRKQERP